jgi:hypothetical protein
VSSITVLKKGLGKQRQVPMQYKKENNENHDKKLNYELTFIYKSFATGEERLKNLTAQS